MIKKLLIAALFVSNWCIAATFTDVTVTGTPYLTTNVMSELYISAVLRNGSVFSATTDVVAGVNYLYENNEGYPVNLKSYWSVTNSKPLIVGVRTMIFFNWGDWWPSVPTNAFAAGHPYPTINAFFAGAGMSSNGYRRAYVYDPTTNNWRDVDDPMYSHTTSSSLATGEILGPWVIDDLQLALNHMQYYAKSWDSFSGYTGTYNIASSYGFSQVSWEASKESYRAWSESSSIGYKPRKLSYGYISTEKDPDQWYASQSAYINTLKSPVIASDSPLNMYGGTLLFAAYATSYYYGLSSSNVFDAFGTVLEQDAYKIFDESSVIVGNTNAVLSSVLGDLTQPAWCSPPAIGVSSSRGYDVTVGRIFSTLTFPYTRD